MSVAVEAVIETFSYPGMPTPALSGIDIKIGLGEFVIIAGPAGSGKTTLCYCLSGVIPKAVSGHLSGRAKILEKDIADLPLPNLSPLLGLVMQSPENQLFNVTVNEDIAFGPENLGLPLEAISERVETALDFTGTRHLADRFSHMLSGGESQRVVLASVLSLQPEIYIFDQPAAELDPAGRRQIYENIYRLNKEAGKTVLLVEDRLSDVVAYADRILLMEAGQIIFDLPPRELFLLPEIEQFGIRVPDSVKLYHALNIKGVLLPRLPLSPEEATQQIRIAFSLREDDIGRERTCSEKRTFEEIAPPPPAVAFENVTYRYPTGVEALSDVSLSVQRESFVAVVGQNGAGKSTLAMHTIGLLRPTAGAVRVLGRDIRQTPVHEVSQWVGFLFQDPDYQTFNNSCLEEVAYGLKLRGLSIEETRGQAMAALERLELVDHWDDHPYTLSRGQRQRLAVATVFAIRPEILVVDEPTTALDYRETMAMMELLERYVDDGGTVITITHDLEMAMRFAQRIVVMAIGEIMLDLPSRRMSDHVEELKQFAIMLPDRTQIARKLGLPLSVRSAEELVEALLEGAPDALP